MASVSKQLVSWHDTLTEVFPCFFLSCKANARVKPANCAHSRSDWIGYVRWHYKKHCCSWDVQYLCNGLKSTINDAKKKSRWGSRFCAPVQTGPGVQPTSCTMGTGSFPGGKERPGRDADPSPPYSDVGHERVELYPYSPPMGRKACTGPQCFYKGDLYLYVFTSPTT